MPGSQSEAALKDKATAAHFGYGAGTGALLAVIDPTPRPAFGAVAGVATWIASYFGWIPAFGVLRSAETHPWRRNKLMISAHLVWGSVTAATLRDLTVARRTMLEQGPLRDAERSEEHTSELQSLMRISSAVCGLKKKHTHLVTDTKN